MQPGESGNNEGNESLNIIIRKAVCWIESHIGMMTIIKPINGIKVPFTTGERMN